MAERYMRTPYGRHTPASAATLGRYSAESIARVGVDVVRGGAVDADRRIRTRVVGVARIDRVRQLAPLPQRVARVAALDRSVEVVPMIEQSQLEPRPLGDVDPIDRLTGLNQAQEMERAVQRADLALRTRSRSPDARNSRRPDEKPFGAQLRELGLETERANDRGISRACQPRGRSHPRPRLRPAPPRRASSTPRRARSGQSPTFQKCPGRRFGEGWSGTKTRRCCRAANSEARVCSRLRGQWGRGALRRSDACLDGACRAESGDARHAGRHEFPS